jgi:SAM-dependent methyltransferase
MTTAYDEIGIGYALTRQPDPRIAAAIESALGDAASVVNVGAGTGSYEPSDRRVIAVEPSATMVEQRAKGAAAVVRGVAEHLPLPDDAVDAALAILTLHHWTDPRQGLAEMRRVARGPVVVLSWDQEIFDRFWLSREYFRYLVDIDRAREVTIEDVSSVLGDVRRIPVPIPHDCVDGFLGAFWRRPEAYLDPRVRSGISTFAGMPAQQRDEGLKRLADDLRDGAWQEAHRDLLDLDELDLGYRLIVA